MEDKIIDEAIEKFEREINVLQLCIMTLKTEKIKNIGKERCKCGHHTKDHSYNPEAIDKKLDCDICSCEDFEAKEEIKKNEK